MKWLISKVGKQRIRFEKSFLKRALGTPGLYSIGYGNVGSSIYYALGIITVYALGATPIVLLIGWVVFLFTALSYAEASTMTPEAGGTSVFARKGTNNELVSFIAGWAIMLDYIVTIAISAATLPHYLGYFFTPLKEDGLIIHVLQNTYIIPPYVITTFISILVILFLMIINVIGVKESSNVNIFFCVLDILTQIVLVLFGVIFLFNLPKLIGYIQGGVEVWPSPKMFLYAISLAMIAYIGLESVTQMAEEAKKPTKQIPASLFLTVITVLVMYLGLSTIALSAFEPKQLVKDWANDPIAGIAHSFGDISIFNISLSTIMMPWVAILAASILLIATNAGLLGASRLTFSMGSYRQLPFVFHKLHTKFLTPYSGIIIFSIVSILLVLPGFFTPYLLLILGDLYSFGALISFSITHLSVILLRIKEPKAERPFKIPFNIRIKDKQIPISAVLGFICTSTTWIIVAATHIWGRNIGFIWFLVGVLIYLLYRKKNKLPITKAIPKHEQLKVIFEPLVIKKILVGTRGTSFCEEMIEAACRLAKKDSSSITALYVIEVSRTLPISTKLPREETLAEEALNRARAIAASYHVGINTEVIKARSAGRAIVEYAKTNNFDLILLGAGGKVRADEPFGETVKYVIENAPCRVWTSMVSIV